MDRERAAARRLQQKLEQVEIKLHKTEAELFDLKMENKLIKASVIDYDMQSQDPTAPPPYADTDGSVPSSSTSSSLTTDNNDVHDDADRIESISLSDGSYRQAVSGKRGKVETVYADIHGGHRDTTSSSTEKGEFTFTTSALDLLDKDK